jgi:hypothetical protein
MLRDVLFMVIERFTPEAATEIYRRVREDGRRFPPGLRYVDSWVQADLRGCFQLMECDDLLLIQEWVASWGDLTDFTIVPVTASRDTADMMRRFAEASAERGSVRPPDDGETDS